MMTDGSAASVWRAEYRPFGMAEDSPNSTTKNALRFPGQYFDSEIGLHQNWFRDYDPKTGRYREADPIGLAGGLNTYAYVEGNPIIAVDPTGNRGIHLGVNPGARLPVPEFVSDLRSVLQAHAMDPFLPPGARMAAWFADGALAQWFPPTVGDALANFNPAMLAPLGMVDGTMKGAVCPRRMTSGQQALKEIVDEVTLSGTKPLSVSEAETILRWADEVNYPGWRSGPGDLSVPSNWDSNPVPHIHLPGAGRRGHVPVAPGVPPVR